LMKIAEMPYSGANGIFIRVLINKKYNLPISVIDALSAHFLGFRSERRNLPVLWHQSLLAFAQRYKQSITAEHKAELKQLLKQHFHSSITKEIRRELFSTKSRGEDIVTDNTEIDDAGKVAPHETAVGEIEDEEPQDIDEEGEDGDPGEDNDGDEDSIETD